MPNRNVHEIMGHLGRDPELRYTTSNNPVCSFSIATSNDFKRDGQWIKNPPEWHNVVIWGELAQLVVNEFKKGDAIMIRGKSRTREYQDKQGQTRRITEVTAQEVFKPVYVSKNERSGHMDLRRQKSEDEKNIEEFEEFPFDEGDLEVDIPF
jgi:single-strand DNA-binding protein